MRDCEIDGVGAHGVDGEVPSKGDPQESCELAAVEGFWDIL